MQENYNVVPNIITGKDLDYLSDMFQWNYGALKKVNDYTDKVVDVEIKEMMQRGFQLFNNNMNQVITILGNGVNNE